MSKYWKATIHVLVEADSEGEACDAMSEGMRWLVDWGYNECKPPVKFPCQGDYKEGDFINAVKEDEG